MTAPFARPATVIVRAPSASYARCLRANASEAIDLDAARLQHAGYVGALIETGAEVVVMQREDELPDACFVEDAAVVLDRGALLTRPGAESRRAEVPSVAAVLERHRKLHTMRAPATLDGGDVLRVANRLFAGLSRRTNDEGIAALREVAKAEGIEVVPLVVRDGLHLKSACTLAAPGLVVFDPDMIDRAAIAAFEAARLETVAAAEPAGANVLAIGDRVLVSAAAPRTAALLGARGLAVRSVDVREIHKGDGALTCLSLRVAAPGTWST